METTTIGGCFIFPQIIHFSKRLRCHILSLPSMLHYLLAASRAIVLNVCFPIERAWVSFIVHFIRIAHTLEPPPTMAPTNKRQQQKKIFVLCDTCGAHTMSLRANRINRLDFSAAKTTNK